MDAHVSALKPSETVKMKIRDLNFYYGKFHALKNINLEVPEKKVTAFIGPSGCGKSTLLRVFNRMYELYPEQRAVGEVSVDGENILTSKEDVALIRAKIGMVFQKPTPFPMSIYDNIAFGVKLFENLSKSALDDRVEWALRKGALGPGLVAVQMGEDLAGSEVWVRIRDDRRDVLASTRAALDYLEKLGTMFNGDWQLALAAYNAGEQNVVRHNGIPPFPETRQFVARVLRRMGDKKSAETVMAKPVPAPQWVSRTPRRTPQSHMVSVPAARPARARPTMVQVSASRTVERPAAQLVLHELEQGPSARTWSSVPAIMGAVEALPPMPAPTVPIGQAP